MRFADANNRTPYNGDWKNFQPRFGFAYALEQQDLDPRRLTASSTWCRATPSRARSEQRSASPIPRHPWSLDSGLTQYATFANPWPAGLTFPPGKDPLAFLGTDAGTPLPIRRNPQYQQWNFSIQREVPGHGVVEVNYSASKGTRLYFGDTNDAVSRAEQPRPDLLGHGRGTRSTSLVPNPFYGVITNPAATGYNQPTIQLNRLLRAVSGVLRASAAIAPSRNIGDSSYHALQVKYEKRFSQRPQRDRALHHLEDDQRLRRIRQRRGMDRGDPGASRTCSICARSVRVSGVRPAAAAGGQLRLPVADRAATARSARA